MQKVVILENIRSLHNVGSIFRTADSAGFQKIFLCGYTGTPPDRRIEKVSLGAENFLEWEKNENPTDCIKKLKKNGFQIIALEQTTQAKNIFEFKSNSKKIAVILGNEVDGVSKELLLLSDIHLEIPMLGQKGSLNVSVSAGIAFYQITNSLILN